MSALQARVATLENTSPWRMGKKSVGELEETRKRFAEQHDRYEELLHEKTLEITGLNDRILSMSAQMDKHITSV